MLTIDTAHRQVERLIQHTVHCFARRHGGDREELLSQANVCWVQAFQHWDANRSKLTTWTQNAIWYGLMKNRSKESKRAIKLPRTDTDLNNMTARRGFDLDSLLENCSPDAATVVELALTAPDQRRGKRKRRATSIRNSIIHYLLDIGWAAARIAASVREIREVLQ